MKLQRDDQQQLDPRTVTPRPLRFGPFELDPRTAELPREGRIVPRLRPLATQGLHEFVSRAGSLTGFGGAFVAVSLLLAACSLFSSS